MVVAQTPIFLVLCGRAVFGRTALLAASISTIFLMTGLEAGFTIDAALRRGLAGVGLPGSWAVGGLGGGVISCGAVAFLTGMGDGEYDGAGVGAPGSYSSSLISLAHEKSSLMACRVEESSCSNDILSSTDEVVMFFDALIA